LTSSKSQNKICAVIPFYNEEEHLHSIISEVIQFVDILILIDDGSTDSSLSCIPFTENIILLEHDKNLGKGAAPRICFLKNKEVGSEKTITMDADYQHDPNYIDQFLAKLEKYDCVIGSRKKDHSTMPYHRKLSNTLTSKLLSWKTGHKILDSQSGYRGFRTRILQDILPNYKGFEAESEMIVKLCKNDYTLGFVNIPTIYGNDNSKMRTFPTIIGFLKVLLRV